MPHYQLTVNSPMGQYHAYVEAESPEAAEEWFNRTTHVGSGSRYTVAEVEEREPRYGYTLVMGGRHWGSGPDLATAKREFRKAGGYLSDGYMVLVFDDQTDFCGVNQMGSYHYLGNPPVSTTVEPRKAASRR